MRWLLFLFSFVSLVVGVLALFVSTTTNSALHSIEGSIWLLIAAVHLVGGSIVDAIVSKERAR